MSDQLSRRDALRLGLAATVFGLGWPTPPALGEAPDRPTARPRRRALRLAYLTDSHIQPERRAYEGVVACLRHLMAQEDRPELVLTGGDLIMDAMDADEARTRVQWDLWLKVLRDECPLPVQHCLGNHDIWGWNKERSGTTGSEPMWGKRWACDLLHLERPYYTFDRAGWKFVVLDSVQPLNNGYVGGIDNTQFDWLREQLERTPKDAHVLVVSHIPILCAAMLVADAAPLEEGGYRVGGFAQVMDFQRIVDLFSRHPNVRAALSGHIHMVDRVAYNGVSYMCGGAVSGMWWRGRERYLKGLAERAKPGDPPRPPRADEGYNLVDLYDDGTVERQYVTYGWTAAE